MYIPSTSIHLGSGGQQSFEARRKLDILQEQSSRHTAQKLLKEGKITLELEQHTHPRSICVGRPTSRAGDLGDNRPWSPSRDPPTCLEDGCRCSQVDSEAVWRQPSNRTLSFGCSSRRWSPGRRRNIGAQQANLGQPSGSRKLRSHSLSPATTPRLVGDIEQSSARRHGEVSPCRCLTDMHNHDIRPGVPCYPSPGSKNHLREVQKIGRCPFELRLSACISRCWPIEAGLASHFTRAQPLATAFSSNAARNTLNKATPCFCANALPFMGWRGG